ncbi:phage portal protein [Weissella diestrammenae]|uniref:Phage portal protein n=2 Tax=Weissella diestrammenae TaxID=1162633 RepID=A0A7G9T7P5_9LACO|nr:phage portal protein [Weissella diestrammenae]QNN76120.1 phage portal protein [Weissella diestrammenae]
MYEVHRRRSYWQRNSIYLDNIYNKIATDVAMMKFKHIRVTRNSNAADNMEWFEFSDLSNVLTLSPNEYEAPFVFWSNVIRDMLQNQVSIVVPVYEKGTLVKLQRVQGNANFNPDGTVNIVVDEISKVVNIADIWIFENPKQNISAQLGEITKLIDDNLHALSSKLNDNSGIRGLLHLPTRAATDDIEDRMNKRLTAFYDTGKDGGVSYLEKGEEFQELSQTYGGTASADELEFLKSQLYNAFGINEKLFTADYNEEQYRAYYQSVVKVYTRVISEEINRKIFTKTARRQGQKVLVYIDMFDIASLKDLNDFAFRQKYSGNFNSNEIREMFGYGAYEGGDTFETNKNAIPIEALHSGKEE